MSDILNKTIVLVLNRNWQAINIRTPQNAFCQVAPRILRDAADLRRVGKVSCVSVTGPGKSARKRC